MKILTIILMYLGSLNAVCWADADLTQIYTRDATTHTTMGDEDYMHGVVSGESVRKLDSDYQAPEHLTLQDDVSGSSTTTQSSLGSAGSGDTTMMSSDYVQHSNNN